MPARAGMTGGYTAAFSRHDVKERAQATLKGWHREDVTRATPLSSGGMDSFSRCVQYEDKAEYFSQEGRTGFG
jgi:hypothetical protein